MPELKNFVFKNRWNGETRMISDYSLEGARVQLEKDLGSLWGTEEDWKLDNGTPTQMRTQTRRKKDITEISLHD